MEKNNNKRKPIIIAIIVAVLVLTIGGTFALWTYFKIGGNQVLIAGDIYMKYTGVNNLSVTNAVPSDTYNKNDYFEFTVEGNNTYANDIIYDIVLHHGDAPEDANRTERIRDDLLNFRLVKVNNAETGETEEELIQEGNYESIEEKRIWVDTIAGKTKEKVSVKYRLYVWVSNKIKIGLGDNIDYDTDTWNSKVYASIKVSVTGDFNDKLLDGEEERTDDPKKDLINGDTVVHGIELVSTKQYDLKKKPKTDNNVKITLSSKKEATKFVLTNTDRETTFELKAVKNGEVWEAQITISDSSKYTYYVVYPSEGNSSTYNFNININSDRHVVDKPTDALCIAREYTGQEQELTTAQTGYSFSNNKQKEVGTYDITAKLYINSGYDYRWKNDEYDDVVIHCSIEKAKPIITLAKTNDQNVEGEFITKKLVASIDKEIDGTYSAVSASPEIATPTVLENNITVKVKSNSEPVKITVTFTPSDDEHYQKVTAEYMVDGSKYKTASLGTCNSNLSYDGKEKTLASGGTGVDYINNKTQEGGTHQVIARLKDDYIWDDTTGADKTLECTVTPKEIIITPEPNQKKQYKAYNPTLKYSYTGFLPIDTPSFTGALNRDTGEEVGSYPINLGSLKLYDKDDFKANNYVLKLSDDVVNFEIVKSEKIDLNMSNYSLLQRSRSAYTGETIPSIYISAPVKGTFTVKTDKSVSSTVELENNENGLSTYLKITGGSVDESFTATVTYETQDDNYITKTASVEIPVKIINKSKYTGFAKTIMNKMSTSNSKLNKLGTTEFYGIREEVTYNYVLYSGKLWRILGVNADGTIKLVTENNITNIWWGTSDFKWVFHWLNNDFEDTLYDYNNIIQTNFEWAGGMYEYGSRNFDIGILTADEVENAKSGETGWIFNGYGFGVMEEEKSVMLYYGPNSGGGASGCTIYSGGIRPVINLKTSVQIASGSGTKTDPYRLVGDKASGKSNEKINTRLSGEYVNFDGKKFRIMNIEDNDTTKLLSYDYLRDENSEVIEKPFSNVRTDVYYGSGTTMDTNNWAGYLNDTSANGWYGKISSKYKNMLVKGTYYLGSIGNVGADSIFKDYRFSVCKTVNNDTTIKTCQKTSKTWTGYVGIPRIGEMYASQEPEIADNVDEHLYLYLTTHDSTKLYYSTTSSDLKYVANSPGTKYAARPTITLDSSVYITSGNGTYESPYEISM